MRAGPLSDATVIETLNRDFVNTWVLNGRLAAVRDSAAEPDARRLAAAALAARKNGSPVDSLLFSTGLELLARQPANDLLSGRQEATGRYRTFLSRATAKPNE